MLREWADNKLDMSTKEEILDIIREYVDLPAEEIPTGEAFKMAAGMDSFIFIAMVGSIEERFGIRIPNSDLLGFNTLDDIIAYVDRKEAER